MATSTSSCHVMALDEASIKTLKVILRNKAYEKYHNVLQKVYNFSVEVSENEKRWAKKCANAEVIIEAEQRKAESATLLRKEDSAVIESLREELEKSWKAIDDAYEKEETANAAIAKLKKQVLDMKSRQSEECGDVERVFEANGKLQKQNKYLTEKLNTLEKQLADRVQWESEMTELRKQLSKKDKLIESTKVKVRDEMKKRAELEEVKKLKSAKMEAQSVKLKNDDSSNMSNQLNAAKMQKQLFNKAKALEKAQMELEDNKLQLKQLQGDLFERGIEIKRMVQQNEDKHKELEKAKTEVDLIQNEMKILRNTLDETKAKYENVTLLKDIATVKENYITLRQESEKMRKDYKKKIHALQKTVDLKKDDKIKCIRLQQKIDELQERLQIKDEEQKNLDKCISKLSRENEKKLILIKQLEQTRDNYTNECKILEEKVQILQEKIITSRHSGLTQMGRVSQTHTYEETENEPNGRIIATLKETVENLKQELELRKCEIFHLKSALEEVKQEVHEAPIIHQTENPQPDIQKLDSDEGEEEIEAERHLLHRIEQLRKLRRKAEEYRKLESDNQALLYKQGIMNESLTLLAEKANLTEEIVRRGRKESKMQIRYINRLKRKVYNLRCVMKQVAKKNKNSPGDHNDSSHSDSTFESLTSRGITENQLVDNPENNTEIVKLSSKLKALEETLADRIKEITEKSECIKEQFEVIDELRKCISSTSAVTEIRPLRDKIRKQGDIIRSLRERIVKYETYIREYQEEVKQLHRKLQHSSKLLQQKRLHENKEQYTECLQTKSLETDLSGKKYRGGGYRVR